MEMLLALLITQFTVDSLYKYTFDTDEWRVATVAKTLRELSFAIKQNENASSSQ